MKYLITTIAALVLVGCGESQQSAPAPESKPVEPVAEAAQSEPPTGKAPDISIQDAAMQGNLEAVKQHIVAGTDVNAKEDGEMTALHNAAYHGHKEIAEYGHKEIAELLITKGAEVNAKDDIDRVPLHGAVGKGHKEIAELLITKGADVNAKSDDYTTPVDEAKSFHHEIADLLRKHGGKTGSELPLATLHEAAMRGDLQKIKYLLAKGADVNEKHKFGDTPLDYAIHGGRRTADLLLKHGAKRGISLKAEEK